MDEDYILQGLFPFGKHRGHPMVELKQDSEYVEWLVNERWFQVRYGDVHEFLTDTITLAELIFRYQERNELARRKKRHARMWKRAVEQNDTKYAERLINRGGLWEEYPELFDEIVRRHYSTAFET